MREKDSVTDGRKEGDESRVTVVCLPFARREECDSDDCAKVSRDGMIISARGFGQGFFPVDWECPPCMVDVMTIGGRERNV